MTERSYPLNAWYAVSWDHELTKTRMLARTICAKSLLFYRKRDGAAVAMDNACWHRLAPLSKGHIVGDNVVCPYHGLVFEPGGRCVHMPSQDTINPAACVRTYPLVERHRLAWVWMGNPVAADSNLIPDLHWNDDPEWTGDGRTLQLKANYLLAIDNLMDLTHETFVHAGSIGNDAVAEAPFQVNHGAGRARVTRWILNQDAPSFWAEQLGKPGLVDRWQIINFTAPSTISLDVGVAPAGSGAPQGDRSQGVNGQITFAITPETETKTHYFWSANRNFRIDSVSLTTIWREGVGRIFAQDEDILEAQQRAIEANPDKIFYDLNIDAGGAWARRKVDEMLAHERGDARNVG
ncbi:aromatic ring-hydroxylating dioxygenase subunit alpha [Rhizobium skierniewicense]|uniref:aromatic ring-hydroxylating dioxygenase subunit alpha n=1 Tax=Rhizobium skierniewicense TaxID=984260 RepID=UPI001572CAA5|nr:aromatic ring-hydroxylating dioxygenase subunit alpha [Rhizobium skierniewicense]NTF34225.1 aromatic ring-hydroxylating dioxygenase subunit alpha [Rhizobium skierniewicense]